MAVRGSLTAGEILEVFRDGQPRTKSELAALTGQSRFTIAQRLETLIAAKLIGEATVQTSTGGRPSAAYTFRGDSQYVLVAELGVRHATYAVTDLSGTVIDHITESIHIDEGPASVMSLVIRALERMVADLPPAPIAGIGVGLPGPVHHDTGRLASPPIMPGWDGFDVKGALGDRFGAPTLIDNDANLLALGERMLVWPEVDDLIYVKVASGVGAGLLVSGQLAHGTQGAAGDIGHVYTPMADGLACRCGNTGCLETVAGGLNIAQALTEKGLRADGAPGVAALAAAGNLDAIRALRDAGRAIGEVLSTCVALLNPGVIVLGGSLATHSEVLITGVREVVYRRMLPLASQNLKIEQARSGHLAGAVGAASLVLDSILEPGRLDDALAGA